MSADGSFDRHKLGVCSTSGHTWGCSGQEGHRPAGLDARRLDRGWDAQMSCIVRKSAQNKRENKQRESTPYRIQKFELCQRAAILVYLHVCGFADSCAILANIRD